MFSRTAYQTASENQRHKAEREHLTQQFHRSLKSLQQKEHVDGAIIVSKEASNNLCSDLEAVFLHGIKDNMMSKLVSYAQGTTTEVKLNFWSAVKRFTHKNVIEQLKDLSQINSDIGLCRAWVRLAINDGLMTSYLASMMADGKAMKAFYHDWAYLLDYEQPDILRNHLSGLMGLRFQLSLNSSVLNTWSTTTVTLAGLIVDPCSLRTGPPSPTTSGRRDSQASVASADSASATATSDLVTSVVDSIVAPPSSSVLVTVAAPSPSTSPSPHLAAVTTTPPNTPADPDFFSHIHDMDVLKRFGRAGVGGGGGGGFPSSSVSSNSSGQASCPDPSEPYEAGGRTSARSSRSNSPHASLYPSLRFMSREDRKLDEETKLRGLLHHWDQRELEREREEEVERERTERERERKAEEEKEEGEKKRRFEERRRKKEEEEEERVKKALVEQAGVERQAGGVMSQRQSEGGKQELDRDGQRSGQPGQSLEGTETSGQGVTALHEQSGVDSLEKVASECQPQDHVDSCPPVWEEGGEKEKEEDEEEWKERESSYGNSLNAMDGWTTLSPYTPLHHHHPHQPHHPRQHHLQQQATLDQSYESMLKGYHAQQGDDSGIATVQKVLDNLPEAQRSGGAKSPGDRENSSEPFSDVDMPEDDIDFTDYEIIHSPEETADTAKMEQMKSLCNFLGKNAQSNTCATTTCNMGVGFFHGPGQICNFDGRTYCDQCHLSQHAYIPAEVVFNWNFKKKKVCAENYKFLQHMQDQPVLDLEEMSSNIYPTVPAMNAVMLLRTQLTSLRSYLFTCSEPTADQLKNRVWPREHLYNKIHTYSLNDLLEVRSGTLEGFLKETVDLCTRHVLSCTLCMGKGFYCELCQEPAPVFPFQIHSTVKCNACKNVYHSRCKTDTVQCPKCLRKGRRRPKDDDDDYACSPDT